jgi:hypothetical protein
MAKYDPLSGHLRRQKHAELELSFAEIERLLSAMLPKRALSSQWWAGEGAEAQQVQCKAWREAGYEAALQVGKDRVRFTRTAVIRP